MGHFRRTRFQIYVCAFLGARKDEGEGGGGSGSAVTRGKYEGEQKRGRYSDATERLENELSLSTGMPRPALRCRGEHSGSSACVMTGKRNDLLTSLPPLTLPPPLHRRSERGESQLQSGPFRGERHLKIRQPQLGCASLPPVVLSAGDTCIGEKKKSPRTLPLMC